MAKTYAQIVAQMPDNTTGLISPEDVRDPITNFVNANLAGAVNTPIVGLPLTDTPVTFDDWESSTAGPGDVWQTNDLTGAGTVTATVDGSIRLYLTMAIDVGTEESVWVAIQKNGLGTGIAASATTGKFGFGGTAINMSGALNVAAGDVLTVVWASENNINVDVSAAHIVYDRVG